MRRRRVLVLVLVLFLFTVLIGSVVAIFTMVGGGGPSVSEGSVLVMDIGGPLPEQPMPDQPLFGQAYVAVIEIDSALRKAAVDDRIDRVLIRPKPLAVGYAKIQEVRDSILRFKEDSDGKPVTCWMETASTKEYYLASACDEIYMAPEGIFLVNGLHMGISFYKGTLDKIGVEAEFTRSGKYKSAIEPMTSEQMSPEFREMMEALADSLYGDFVGAIAQARGLSETEVRDLVDDPPFSTSGALAAGLIDGLLYKDQLDDFLSGRDIRSTSFDLTAREGAAEAAVTTDSEPETPEEPVPAEAGDEEEDKPDIERVSFDEYSQVKPSSLGLGKGPKVAVLYAEGQIMSGSSSPGGALSTRTMGSDTITGALRAIRKDDSIKALVIRVDSPGGSGLASDVMWREVGLVREKIPVVVSMSDYAASGGYYIAMGADAIVAQPGTLTGSIGVFAGKYNLGGLYEKIGVNNESIKRGEMSDIFSPSRPLGEDGQAKLSEYVDQFYGTFVTKAAEGRSVSYDDIHAVAQGRVWTGKQAKDIGLIDEVGGFRTALQLAKEKAGIDGEVQLKMYPRQPTFIEQLLGQQPSSTALAPLLDTWTSDSSMPLGTALQSVRDVFTSAPLFADGRPVVMAPYRIQVW